MRAPRRTPYERPDALDHLYSLLYPSDQCDIINDDGYRNLRREGLSIVHLWLNRSACPHAVESTGSLIGAQQLDEQILMLSLLPPSSRGSEWAVRCAYSTAILRFVNSVVDTFQTAMFAKSIFQISQKIGLPAYLVELRHAATHEELPSLLVLRDACRESLLWLQRSFWWPTLAGQQSKVSNQINNKTNGSSSSFAVDLNELQQEAMSELRVDLARYRKLAKRVVKDESLRGRYKTALTGAQNKVEASAKRYEAAFTQGRGTVSQGEEWEEEQVDGSAAALLVDTLLEAGGLIPLSKRKRPRSMKGQNEDIVKLPPQLLQIWLPLLKHLSASVEGFADALQEGLIASLSATLEKSYQETAASWIIALFGDDKSVLTARKPVTKQLHFSSDISEDEDDTEQDRPTLILARKCLTAPSAMSLGVTRLLCAKDERLSMRIKPLLEMAETASSHQSKKEAEDDKMTIEGLGAASDVELSVLEMEKRLEALQEKPKLSQDLPPMRQGEKTTEQSEMQQEVCRLLPGWNRAPSDWTPTPIGCLNGRVPNLVLSEG